MRTCFGLSRPSLNVALQIAALIVKLCFSSSPWAKMAHVCSGDLDLTVAPPPIKNLADTVGAGDTYGKHPLLGEKICHLAQRLLALMSQ